MLSGIVLRPARRGRRLALLLLAAVCLGLGGCGLAGYEDQMASEQLRIARFDDENEYLGAPLDIPKPKDPKDPKGEKELDVPPVFLRPPKGIGPKPDQNAGPGSFYHYVRDGQRVTGKAAADRLVYTDVYVWVAPAGQKGFDGDALRAFASQLQGIPAEKVTEYPLKRLARQQNTGRATEPLVFNPSYRNPAAGGLSLYVYQQNGANVAIAYQLVKDRTAPKFTRTGEDGNQVTLTVTDLSLESFGVDRDVKLLREMYDRRKRH